MTDEDPARSRGTTGAVGWQQMGAASGLLAMALFASSFAVFLGTDPGGDLGRPSIADAETAPAFIAANLNPFRVELLLSSLGLVIFLWFLGSFMPTLRSAEGEPARGSTIASIGAIVGTTLVLTGIAVSAATGLSSGPLSAQAVPALYAGSALLVALGGGVFALFFLGVAEVVLRTGVMAKWVGLFTLVPAALCLVAFTAPFFAEGALNAGNGALGRYAWFVAMVVWLLIVAVVLTVDEFRAARSGETSAGPTETGGVA